MENDYSQYLLDYHTNQPVHSLKELKQKCEHSVYTEMWYRCLKEMYARSQPSENLDKLLDVHFKNIKNGFSSEQFYLRYYLSAEEFRYILNKYINAFNINQYWQNCIDILIADIQNGYSKDKYIPDYIDKYGNHHPGYRGYEKISPMKELLGEEVTNKIIDFLKDRKHFYKFDRKGNEFSTDVALGISPNSNENSVRDYWKSQGIDIEINPRHYSEDYFWEEENGDN